MKGGKGTEEGFLIKEEEEERGGCMHGARPGENPKKKKNCSCWCRHLLLRTVTYDASHSDESTKREKKGVVIGKGKSA